MPKTLWILAGLALAALGYGVWAGHAATLADHRRVAALQQRQLDSVVALGNQSQAFADSIGRSRDHRADSLMALLHRPRPPVPAPDTTVRDSLRYWRARTTALEADSVVAHQVLDARTAEIGSLEAQLTAQQAATAQFRAAYAGEHTRAEGALVALRKMPTGCRKLFGLPMPRVGPGAALTTQGVVPTVALIIPLGC